jgi:hypothetical protein
MKTPPFKCLFCLSATALFTRVEHPIPESLGNDDLILEPGFVCDACNQYFGTKVESPVISAPPFGVERVRSDVKTKKGKHPVFKSPPHIDLYPTGFKDKVILAASPQYWKFMQKKRYLLLPNSPRNDVLIVRFLLKVGLELLLTADGLDPYSSQFDNARTFARSPFVGAMWKMAYGVYPRQDDLILSERTDEIGPVLTHQLYQWEMGVMGSGDVTLCFVYAAHVFACNLSRPSISEYVNGFNSLNDFKLEVIETHNVSMRVR